MLKKIIGKKKILMLMLGIIVGILISVVSAYAVTLIDSKNVTYDNNKSELVSDNVQDAIDELYNKVYPNGQLLSNYIINLFYNSSNLNIVHIGGDNTKPIVTLNEKQGLMLDNNNEYRYYGSDPNNYVWFNDELWRIISVSNVKNNETDTKGSLRVKLIRNESIGNYSYDSSENTVTNGYGINYWVDADINNELNTLYLNQEKGKCYNGQNNVTTECDFTSTSDTKGLGNEAKNMIDNALYYLGGMSNTNLYAYYANDYYDKERGTEVWSNCKVSWSGKIGLMYPSDYAYATDLSKCTNPGYDSNQNDYRIASCKDNEWLTPSSAASTITVQSIEGYGIYYINLLSYIGWANPNNAYVTNPVVYLKANVTVEAGYGTKDKPYRLNIK